MDRYQDAISMITEFRDKRDWKQFHNSKDLALAISIEASELNERFLWKSQEEVNQMGPDSIKDELADILIYALFLAEKHDLDIFDIIIEKMTRNGENYPVDKAKGNAKKYCDFEK